MFVVIDILHACVWMNWLPGWYLWFERRKCRLWSLCPQKPCLKAAGHRLRTLFAWMAKTAKVPNVILEIVPAQRTFAELMVCRPRYCFCLTLNAPTRMTKKKYTMQWTGPCSKTLQARKNCNHPSVRHTHTRIFLPPWNSANQLLVGCQRNSDGVCFHLSCVFQTFPEALKPDVFVCPLESVRNSWLLTFHLPVIGSFGCSFVRWL